MAAIGNTISSDLAAQIQVLSSIKDDSTLAPTDKQAKLKQEGEKTLAMIAMEKGSLSIVNLAFASNIQDVIQAALASSDWDSIPPPSVIKREIADLHQVSQALSLSLKQGINDIREVMKLLIEINDKYAGAKSNEWLQNMKSSLDIAKEQFKKTEESINQQQKSDKTAAGGQIAGGLFSGVMSAGSMVGSAINAKKQLSALKNESKLKIQKDNFDGLKELHAEQKQKFKSETKELDKLKASPNRDDAKIAIQQTKADNADNLVKRTKTDHDVADHQFNKARKSADKINIRNNEFQAYMNNIGGFGNAGSSLINSSVSTVSADEKAAASHLKNEADKAEFQKNFIQNMAQQRFDSVQKAVQSIDKGIQAMTNIEQSNAGQLSSANRA
jgi:hypothetical protein